MEELVKAINLNTRAHLLALRYFVETEVDLTRETQRRYFDLINAQEQEVFGLDRFVSEYA